MNDVSSRNAVATLISLQDRLRRVEWYLSGSDELEIAPRQAANAARDDTVQARLAGLISRLDKVSTQSPTVNTLLKLHTRYPDLFQPSTSGVPTTLSTAELLSMIESCATSYPTTASRLNAIKDLPIPPPETSAALIALHPRLAKVEMLQESQAQEMSELRRRSASVIQRWYELGVLGESECWAEWEERLVDVEKRVRREELHQAQEDKESNAYGPT